MALLSNEEVLAVNQDAGGSRGRRISSEGTTEVWAKDLQSGGVAVALFNRGRMDATVSVSFDQLGISGTPVVRNSWQRENVPDVTDRISVTVPGEGAHMYTVTPR